MIDAQFIEQSVADLLSEVNISPSDVCNVSDHMSIFLEIKLPLSFVDL